MADERVLVMNAVYTNMNCRELLDATVSHVKTRHQATVIFLNTDVVVKMEKDPYLAKIVEEAEYVIADGMPLIWISKLFHRGLKERVCGSDFVPLLCERAAGEGLSLFFVGGAPDVAAAAVRRLQRQYPKIRIAGFDSPPVGFEKDPKELERLNEHVRQAAPDILIACLGCPKQEKYLYENREKLNSVLYVCAGATIDFMAGKVKRAPAWMRRCGLEWFYRFLREPKRLFRRYFVDDMQVLRLMLRYWGQRRETQQKMGIW